VSEPIYKKTGEDDFGDEYTLKVWGHGTVSLVVEEADVLVEHDYTPEAAEKLAKRLKKAAKLARSVR
jgi:hypothetical protein